MDIRNPLRIANGLLTLYYSADIGTLARLDALAAAEEHWIECATGVAALVTSIQGVGVYPFHVRVFVHSRPYLQAPHAAHVLGYVDLDSPGRDVHVVLGPGSTVPDLLHQLVHALWYPRESWDQAPSYVLSGQRVTLWTEVLARQDALVSRLKFVRGVP
jgi:hypothetical protein